MTLCCTVADKELCGKCFLSSFKYFNFVAQEYAYYEI